MLAISTFTVLSSVTMTFLGLRAVCRRVAGQRWQHKSIRCLSTSVTVAIMFFTGALFLISSTNNGEGKWLLSSGIDQCMHWEFGRAYQMLSKSPAVDRYLMLTSIDLFLTYGLQATMIASFCAGFVNYIVDKDSPNPSSKLKPETVPRPTG